MSGKEEVEDIFPAGNQSDNSVSDEKQDVANAETARHWSTANDQQAANASANTKLKPPYLVSRKRNFLKTLRPLGKRRTSSTSLMI
jgi:hypothetical protein